MLRFRIQTPRLTLVAATADLLRAEMENRGAFDRALKATTPSDWPPRLYESSHMQWALTQLEREPNLEGWLTWFWLLNVENQKLTIGLGGFKGKPNEFGAVEIGYTVLESFQKQGFATEAVQGLSNWAFDHPDVTRVVAETLPELPASIRVLRKCGFEFVGNGSDIEVLRFERKRSNR